MADCSAQSEGLDGRLRRRGITKETRVDAVQGVLAKTWVHEVLLQAGCPRERAVTEQV